MDKVLIGLIQLGNNCYFEDPNIRNAINILIKKQESLVHSQDFSNLLVKKQLKTLTIELMTVIEV